MATVLTTDHDEIRVITLNRPQRRNAIDLELRVALADAVSDAMRDDVVRAIVLTGAGGTFCSGGDVSTMQRQSPQQARPRSIMVQRVTREIWSGPKPVVAAVEGSAVGAGLALALACDRVVAGRSARFAASFVKVGLAGDMGIFATLPARVGPHRAKQLMMFAETLDADQALESGLVDVVTDDEGALERAMADAALLAAGPAQALAAIKGTLGNWPRDPYEVLAAETDTQTVLFDSDDFGEAVDAFAERRTPDFRRSRP